MEGLLQWFQPNQPNRPPHFMVIKIVLTLLLLVSTLFYAIVLVMVVFSVETILNLFIKDVNAEEATNSLRITSFIISASLLLVNIGSLIGLIIENTGTCIYLSVLFGLSFFIGCFNAGSWMGLWTIIIALTLTILTSYYTYMIQSKSVITISA